MIHLVPARKAYLSLALSVLCMSLVLVSCEKPPEPPPVTQAEIPQQEPPPPAWEQKLSEYPPQRIYAATALDALFSTQLRTLYPEVQVWLPAGGGLLGIARTKVSFFRVASLLELGEQQEAHWQIEVPGLASDWLVAGRSLYLDIPGYGTKAIEVQSGKQLWNLVEPSLTTLPHLDLHSLALLDDGRVLLRSSPDFGLLHIDTGSGDVLDALEFGPSAGLRKISEQALLVYPESEEGIALPARAVALSETAKLEVIDDKVLAAWQLADAPGIVTLKKFGSRYLAQWQGEMLWELESSPSSELKFAYDESLYSSPLVIHELGNSRHFYHVLGGLFFTSASEAAAEETWVYVSGESMLEPLRPLALQGIDPSMAPYGRPVFFDDGLGLPSRGGFLFFPKTDAIFEPSTGAQTARLTNAEWFDGQAIRAGVEYHLAASRLPFEFEFRAEVAGTVQYRTAPETRALRVEVWNEAGQIADSAQYSGLADSFSFETEAGNSYRFALKWPGAEQEKQNVILGFSLELVPR